MKWFRWHRGTVENPKFALVAAEANCPTGAGEGERVIGAVSLTDVIAVWSALLEDAASDDHWGVCHKDAKYLAIILRWRPEEIQSILDAMAANRLISPAKDGSVKILKWNEYQYTSDSDPTSAERQRRYYNRHKTAKSRKPNALGSRPDTDSEADTEKKKEGGAVAPRFSEFWLAYPARSGPNPKKPASERYASAVKHGVDPDLIIGAAKRYADEIKLAKTDPKFVAQAVTWLNQERWNDQPKQLSQAGRPMAFEG